MQQRQEVPEQFRQETVRLLGSGFDPMSKRFVKRARRALRNASGQYATQLGDLMAQRERLVKERKERHQH